MKEEFYFVLFCGSYVANTYVGTRSNAKAYFLRWVRKNFSFPNQYIFLVERYGSMHNMLHRIKSLDGYELPFD